MPSIDGTLLMKRMKKLFQKFSNYFCQILDKKIFFYSGIEIFLFAKHFFAIGISAIRALNDVLVHIRNNTRCVCDDGQQQQQQPTANGGAGGDTNNNGKVPPPPFGRGIWIDQCEKAPNAHGFTVSVAVVEKMEVSDDQRRRYRR